MQKLYNAKMEALPAEIICVIMQWFYFRDIIAIASCNRRLRKIVANSRITTSYIFEIDNRFKYPQKFIARNFETINWKLRLVSILVTDETTMFKDFPRSDKYESSTLQYTDYHCVICGIKSYYVTGLKCFDCNVHFDPKCISTDFICFKCEIIISTGNSRHTLCTSCHTGDCRKSGHPYEKCIVCKKYFCKFHNKIANSAGKPAIADFGDLHVCSAECAIAAKTCNICKKYNVKNLVEKSSGDGYCYKCAINNRGGQEYYL